MKIPLYKVFWDEKDVEKVLNVIKRGTYWTLGPEIKEFEAKLAEYVGVEYAVTFNSGTSALHAALLALDIGKQDEVIVPSFTFIATSNSVLFVGATPKFAEIEEERYALDPNDVIAKIDKNTKAIMPIHYGGMPARIKELKEIAQDKKIYLIEDAAESLGAITEEGKKVGSYGDISIISFCGNKVITTGEGGAALTNDRRLYEKLLLIRSHGRLDFEGEYFTSSKKFEYITLGYNWRISSLTAALGISQLEKIEEAIKLRRKIAKLYEEKFNEYGLTDIVIPFREPPGTRSVYQMYTVRFTGGQPVRDKVKDHLSKNGIGVKIYFEPVHLTEFYKKLGYKQGIVPRTEKISKEVLTLPIYPLMSENEVEYVVQKIKEATM